MATPNPCAKSPPVFLAPAHWLIADVQHVSKAIVTTSAQAPGGRSRRRAPVQHVRASDVLPVCDSAPVVGHATVLELTWPVSLAEPTAAWVRRS